MPSDRDAHLVLRDQLYRTLRLRPNPLVRGSDFTIPGATLWTGARTWVNRFRAAGLGPGDRVVLRVPRTPAHIMVTIAAWWEGLTLCPVAPRDATDQADLLRTFGASCIVDTTPGPHALVPNAAGDAPSSPADRRTAGDATEGVALIMTTSGSTGAPTRIALSYGNLLHQLTTHTEALGLTESDTMLSVLPWNHAFGMLVDLWPALLSGAGVIVDDEDGRSAETILQAVRTHDVTRLSLVPLQAAAVADLPGGEDALRSLAGGVIGGAPVSGTLAERLAGTRLRVGYGQTEASPGIALGEPGEFEEGTLGNAIGCETRVVSGELQVRGANVCVGFWRDGTLHAEPTDRWLATGDLVEPCDTGLRFVGRRDHRFKLDNGRMVDAPSLERKITRALPEAEAVVFAVDGTSLGVALVWPGSRMRPASSWEAELRQALGHDARRLTRVISLGDSPDLRTRKGELDRSQLIKAASAGAPITTVAA